MRTVLLTLAMVTAAAGQAPETAESIMERVAANQDRAERLRSSFVYRQKLLMSMRRANHKLAREERSEFTVTPGPNGIEKKLVHFSGRYRAPRQVSSTTIIRTMSTRTPISTATSSPTSPTISPMPRRATASRQDLFPLTAEEQSKYTFQLAGRETRRGRDVYRIAFRPRPGVEDRLLERRSAHRRPRVPARTRLHAPGPRRAVLGQDRSRHQLEVPRLQPRYDRFEEGRLVSGQLRRRIRAQGRFLLQAADFGFA